MKLLHVYDAYVQFFDYQISNALICCILNSAQLIISATSLGQHIYSLLYADRKVFACSFVPQEPGPGGTDVSGIAAHFETNDKPADQHLFLEYDVIIYDFRLFQRIWGIDKCIANYMDGGYMRFIWCITHVLVIIKFLLAVVCITNPKPFILWPILAMQSFYSIGLLVLTLSATPKFLPLLFGNVDRDTILPICLYILAVSLNFFLTYILWHYYWHLCGLYELKDPDIDTPKRHYIIVKNGKQNYNTAVHV